MPRQRIPLPFGPGLDRASGTMIVQPNSMSDMRNFYPRDGKVYFRPGLSATAYPAIGWGTDIVGIFPLRSKLEELMVVFDRATDTLRLYRINPVGPTVQLVASAVGWGALDPAAPLPRFVAAESYGQLFIAHDEKTYVYRQPTIYYTPNANDALVGTMTVLQAADSGGVNRNVFFRGVYSYLDYLWGWGFGDGSSAANANRPEYVRASKPGDPLTFPIENFFLAGVRDDPVLSVSASGHTLRVSKKTEAYRIFGTDAATFGIELADALNGCVAARLALPLGDALYEWAESGPRVSHGDVSNDLAIPLELDGPHPTSLADHGGVEYGFAVYDDGARLLYFCFPDVENADAPTRVYMLSLRDPTNPCWSYGEIQQCVYCAGIFYNGKAPPPAVVGYVSAITAADVGINADNASRRIQIDWTNNTPNGDEVVDVFAKPSGGAWTLMTSVAIGGVTQSTTLAGFDPIQDYTIAMRFRRGSDVKVGYEGSDPDAWSGGTVAGARQTFTTSCATPTAMTAGVWERTSALNAQVALSWSLTDLYAPIVVQKATSGGGPWTDVITLDGASTPRAHTYIQQGGEGATTMYFRVIPKRVAISGTASGSVNRWMGWAGMPVTQQVYWAQDAATTFSLVFIYVTRDNTSYFGADAVAYEVETSPTGVGSWTTRRTGAASARQVEVLTGLTPEYTNGTKTFIRLRAGYSTFGVTDFGPWVTSPYINVDSALVIPGAMALTPQGAYPNYDTGPQINVGFTRPINGGDARGALIIPCAGSGTGLWCQVTPYITDGGLSGNLLTGSGRSGTQVRAEGWGMLGKFFGGDFSWRRGPLNTSALWNNLP